MAAMDTAVAAMGVATRMGAGMLPSTDPTPLSRLLTLAAIALAVLLGALSPIGPA
jgi:hypothetical protein